ncbi:MAG: GNAT family N-acetyltransferase [Victivallales bacterium]|nr:GNAT family N-acetyltransferase [Victivallales bacterium]
MSESAAKESLILRQATEKDVTSIHRILSVYAAEKLLLPLSRDEIAARISSFTVASLNNAFAGCASIRDFGSCLFEVRSLAVSPNLTSKSIGSAMVRKIISEISWNENTRLFALTYRTSFFERLGFRQVSKELFPQKIWLDCSRCTKKEACDEVAVMLDFETKCLVPGE